LRPRHAGAQRRFVLEFARPEHFGEILRRHLNATALACAAFTAA